MSIIPTPEKNLNSLTKLDKERALKKLRGETEELIDEMGHENERRAIKTVSKYVKELQKQEEKQKEIDVEQLKALSTNKKNYQRYLIVILSRFVKEEKIPKHYSLYVDSDDTGIILGIEKTNFMRAFKVCGIPFYDINACKILSVQLGNTIAKLEGYVTKSEGGIILPDYLDKKKYA